MADTEMPDVLTPAQMRRLGGAATPDDLPDTLTPDQMERASEKPQQYPPTEDERLGIDSGMASPTGMVWDSKAKEFRRASELGRDKPLPPGFVPERGLQREDPAMDVATTIAGAGTGKVAGKAIGKLSPILSRIVEPAVAGATTTALQGGSKMDTLKAGGIGAALGVPGAALSLVRGAPAAVAERLPAEVTGGMKTKAAKKVLANDAIGSVLDAHPDLKKTLATSTNPEERLGAAASVMNKLETANDAVYDAVQKHHGGVPLADIASKLDDLAQDAHGSGDLATVDAVEAAKANLDRLAKNGNVTAQQLRGVRNALAARIQTAAPGTPAAYSQAAATAKIKGALNEAIEDVASKTPGVDVAALKERNRHIASLLPVKQSLEEQKLKATAAGPHDPLGEMIRHPRHVIAGVLDRAPAYLDSKLAESPRLQRFSRGLARPALSVLAASSPLTAPAVARSTKRHQNDLEYAARVSQLMDGGMSLQEAVEKANEQ